LGDVAGRSVRGRKAAVELVIDRRDPEGFATFWRKALGYCHNETDADLDVLVPRVGRRSPVLLQAVPEDNVLWEEPDRHGQRVFGRDLSAR
jgi:Glyoxalase-like domain